MEKMNRTMRYTLLSLFLTISVMGYAQQKPFWHGFQKDLENSSINIYYGTGDTFEQALNSATQQVIQMNALAKGFNAGVRLNSDGTSAVSGNSQLKTEAKTIASHHYEKDGEHHVYLLVQVAKRLDKEMENVEITKKYNCIAKSFVPGMAQLKKGQTGKGVFFIAAEAACIGTIIVAEAQRASFQSKIKTTQSAQQKLSYKDKANTWSTARNVAIAGTAAFYVWNVIDGIVGKGKKHIKIGGEDVAMSPWTTLDESGLAMRITF